MIHTERLDLRPPEEHDRDRFVELFGDADFMAFSGGVLDTNAGHARFDVMLSNAQTLPFAKQPVIERATGTILGYSGVAWFDFEGERCPEFGYRLAPDARGKGYATEAGNALVELARTTFSGTIYAMIDPTNLPSQRVADKLGFVFWKESVVNGYLDRLYRLEMP